MNTATSTTTPQKGGFPMPSASDFQSMSPDQFELFWKTFEAMGTANSAPFRGRWFVFGNEIRDICTLKHAGWKPEPQTSMTQLMAWFWRRPIRPGSRDRIGKRFQSTSSAMAELRRIEMRASTSITNYAIEYKIDGISVHGVLAAKSFLHARLLADSIHANVVTAPPS